MIQADEQAEVVAAVASLRARFGIPADPAQCGPVLLGRFLEELNVIHLSFPVLTRAEVIRHLRLPPDGLNDEANTEEVLAGCLLKTTTDGYIFVGQHESLENSEGKRQLRFTTQPRQRFTVAHELGHFVLHRECMQRFIADTKESVIEDNASKKMMLMERQANLFAALLLMPEEVCWARANAFRKAYGVCPRSSFGYHMAAELLVSPEAMRFRLEELGIGDE